MLNSKRGLATVFVAIVCTIGLAALAVALKKSELPLGAHAQTAIEQEQIRSMGQNAGY